jgi:hypothetical protein
MRIPASALFIARLLFLGFVILSAGYCLLAYIPFTYQQIHVGGLLSWLNAFLRFHPLIYWFALVLVGLSIHRELRERPLRKSAWTFAVAGMLGGIGLAIHPVLTDLRNDASSAAWALVWLVPAVWLGVLDLFGNAGELRWAPGDSVDDDGIFAACWQTGALLAVSYFISAYLRMRAAHNPEVSSTQKLWVLAAAVATELLLWMMVFCLLELIQLAASRVEQKLPAAFLGSVLATWFLGWLVVRFVIFPTVSLAGFWNWMLSIAVSGTVAIYFAGTSVRLSVMSGDRVESGLALLLQPFRFIEDSAWWLCGLSLITVGVAGWYLSWRASLLDWDFLIQKTLASVIAVTLFAIFYFINHEKKASHPASAYAIAGAVLFAYLCVGALEPKVTYAADGTSGATRLLDQYADYDVAFRLADDLLTQPKVGTRHSGSHENFYAFLAENTHIPRSKQVAPVDVQLVKSMVPADRKPNIFVFVIDSLRRDYVSPYNPSVDFTPAIGAFAGESTVFNNAFTRYGGTGLSEPSIWLGGLMLHKQYITPFAPMNALQKLMDAEQYEEFVSKDTILQTVVGPSNAITELDAHIGTMNYEFCTTLTELTGKLAERKDDARPVFAYTQPQNIHVSVIDHEGRSVPPTENAPAGFERAYASRVRRIDACFGKFIQYLKQSGAYENSIVVLTSDHGDFLGERGQWGHAYSLAPEVTRVPLIIHLPEWMQKQVVADTNSVAFTTDVTPTLYYLLGQKPIVRNGIYGRPLVTSATDQPGAVHDSYLLASSYAPVYGLLMSNGRLLYVADGVNYTDSAYETGSDGSNTPITVTPELRKRGQQGIRDQVNEVAHFYRLR